MATRIQRYGVSLVTALLVAVSPASPATTQAGEVVAPTAAPTHTHSDSTTHVDYQDDLFKWIAPHIHGTGGSFSFETSVPTSGLMEYGIDGNFDTGVILPEQTIHWIDLNDLTEHAQYYYRITMHDKAGKEYRAEGSFHTDHHQSHYRYGTLSWVDLGSGRVRFTQTNGFRRSYYPAQGLANPQVGQTFPEAAINFGDGTSSGPITMTITQSNSTDDWIVASYTTEHTYTGNGPYTAYWQNSARLSAPLHRNNPDVSWRLETVVNLPGNSPVSNLPPIVDCPKNSLCSFRILGVHPDNNTLSYRMALSAEARSSAKPAETFRQPAGASIDATTGVYSWDTGANAVTSNLNPNGYSYFSSQVMIQDGVTKTPIDFFLRLVNANQQVAPGTPASGTIFTVPVGQPITFPVGFTDPEGDPLTMMVYGLPQGATFPIPVASGSVSSTFTWTPSASQAGSYVISFGALDPNREGIPPVSIGLQITGNRPPSFTSAGTNTSQTTPEGHGLASLVATDPDNHALTYSLVGGSLPPGISLQPDGSFTGTATYQASGSYSPTVKVEDGYGGSATTTVAVTVQNVDTLPTLQAVPDQSNQEGDSVTLALVGADVDGDTLTYSATGLPDGLAISPVTGVISGQLSYQSAGPHSVVATVTDNTGNHSASQTFTWNVANVNRPPSFTAALTNTAQSVSEGGTLAALVASDPDGEPLTYTVTGGALPPTVTLNPDGTFAGNLTYQAAAGSPYSATIQVSDPLGAKATTTLTITVANTDTVPVLAAIPDRTDAEGAFVTLSLLGSDLDGDTLTYSATNLPPGLSLNPTTGVISGTLPYGTAQVYTVTAKVQDNTGGGAATRSFNWTVTHTNRAPSFTQAGANTAQSINEAEGLVALAAVDPDGDPLTFAVTGGALPPGLTLNLDGTFSGVASYDAAGTHTATITVTDGHLSAVTTLTLPVSNVNRAPAFTLNPANTAQVIDEGNGLAPVQAVDPDGDLVTYQLAGGSLPPGISLLPAGSFAGTATYQAAGTYSVTITVRDAHGATSQTALSITVNNVDTAPTVAPIAPQHHAEGGVVSLPVIGNDLDGDTLTYAASGLPANLAIDPATGLISGTLTYDSVGTYHVTVTVADPSGSGHAATTAFDWTVTDTNRPPVYTGDATNTTQTVAEGARPARLLATDPDGNSLTFTLTGGSLPPGLTLNPDGSFSGAATYQAAGTYSPTITVSDGLATATTNLALVVTIVDTVPHLDPVANQASREGESISLQMVGSVLDGDALTYRATGLPPGLSINSVSGLISGTLSYEAAGLHAVTVTVADSTGAGTDSVAFNWQVVNTNRAPTFTAESRNTAQTIGEGAGLQPLAATDPDGDPLTYTMPSGTLPLGIRSEANGTFSGTAAYTAAGSYSVVIEAHDGNGAFAQSTLAITVTNVDTIPVLQHVADQSTAEGAPVLLSLEATDVDGDALSWTVTGLPPGLSFDPVARTISGTPPFDAAGTYTVTVTVADNPGANTAKQTLTWHVTDTNRPPVFTPAQANLTQSIAEGAGLSPVTATDPDGNALTYSLTEGALPPGITLNADGTFAGTASYEAAGTHRVTITADDGHGGTAKSTLAIVVTNTNRPPAFTDARTNRNQAIAEAAGLAPVLAVDPDGGGLTYSLAGGTLPPGITLNPDGSFAGTATYAAAGSYTVTIQAHDPEGAYGTTGLTIVVANVDTEPTLEPVPDQVSAEGHRVSLTIVGNDADGDTLIYSAQGLPSGLITNAQTGLITGHLNYESGGLYTVTVTVQDPGGHNTHRTFRWTILGTLAAGNVNVTVRDIETRQAIAGATVALSGAGAATGVTDTSGRSSFSVMEGPYDLKVTAPGYQNDTSSIYVGPLQSTNGEVLLRADRSHAAKLALTVTASPETLVGDGKSSSTLTATVRQPDGTPAAGVNVSFAVTGGTLSADRAVTAADGTVAVRYTAPAMTGITTRTEKVTATVYDPARGLFGEATITLTITPAAIEGTVTDAAGHPVAGALVELAEDFDGDGTVDFHASMRTGADGKYHIAVPRGNWTYRPLISYPVQVSGTQVTLRAPQPSNVAQVSGTGEVYLSTNRVGGQLMLQSPTAGAAAPLAPYQYPGSHVEGEIQHLDGSPVAAAIQVGLDGSYQSDALEPGEYQLLFRMVAPNGQKLAGVRVPVTIGQSGDIAMQPVLVDPFGIVTDVNTDKPVAGVKMRLFWADTERNRLKGRTADTEVDLPVLPQFPPNQNTSPQLTTAAGAYAWMVFPDGDYYVSAERAGYLPYDSRKEGRNVPAKAGESSSIENGIIHIGATMVELNVRLAPNPATAHDRYIKGYPDGTFKPERAITRAEVATVLARINGLTQTGPLAQYPDVPDSHWAARNIALVRQAGLMTGDPSGEFRPDEPITRAEVAVIAVRMKGRQPSLRPSQFVDTLGHWADRWIAEATAGGLVSGFPMNTFRPADQTTRAQFVTIINRALMRGPLTGLATASWPDVPTTHWAWGQVEEASHSHRFQVTEDGTEVWRGSAPDPELH